VRGLAPAWEGADLPAAEAELAHFAVLRCIRASKLASLGGSKLPHSMSTSQPREDRRAHRGGADARFAVAAGGDIAGAQAIGDGLGDGGFDSVGGFEFT